MAFAINGSATSMAPVSVNWIPRKLGEDHLAAPLYAAVYDVVMDFSGGSVSYAQQWLAQASGAGSVNLTIIDRWQTGFTILSAVQLELSGPPQFADINLGPFSITVHGAIPTNVVIPQ